MLEPVVSQSSNIIAKGSLMPDGTGLEIVNRTIAKKFAVEPNTSTITKTVDVALAIPVAPAAPATSKVQIVPASID